jgi:hypothetical protein
MPDRAPAGPRHVCTMFADIWCGAEARYRGAYRIFAAARARASFAHER